METGWFFRRGHMRQLRKGRAVLVRGTWVYQAENRKGSAYKHVCPHCGADIVSVRMARGGWGHFEGRKGLGRIKHPCLHLGEMLSRRRDNKTLDMFEVPAAKDESVDSSVTCNELRSAPYKVEFHQAGTKCEEYHDSQS